MRWIFLLFTFLASNLMALPSVLVSVPPQKYLVDRISEKKINAFVVVPKGASPHTYEPSAQQLKIFSDAKLWFTIGESFEWQLKKALPIPTVNQLEDLPLIYQGCCCHSGADTHVWLSPRLLKQMALQIQSTLAKHYPELQDLTQKNLQILLNELNALDSWVSNQKLPSAFLTSHPAFGYFCRDYHIQQVAIEEEGKEPSAKKVIQLSQEITQKNIQKLLIQPHYFPQASKRLAEEWKLQATSIDPYNENPLALVQELTEQLTSNATKN